MCNIIYTQPNYEVILKRKYRDYTNLQLACLPVLAINVLTLSDDYKDNYNSLLNYDMLKIDNCR